MATITGLPSVPAVSTSAVMPLVQNNVTVQAPVSAILALAAPFALPSKSTTQTGDMVALVDASGNPYQVPLSALTITTAGASGGTTGGSAGGTSSTGGGVTASATQHILTRLGGSIICRNGTYLTFRTANVSAPVAATTPTAYAGNDTYFATRLFGP